MGSREVASEKIDCRPVIIGRKLRYYVDFEADKTSIDFLRGLNLDMSLRAVESVRDSEDVYWKQQGAMLSRQLYYQSLEILFSLLIATLQSPRYPVAWLINYTNKQLRDLVGDISLKRPIPVLVRPIGIGWLGLVEFMLSFSSLSSRDDFKELCQRQAGLLSDLAHDLVSEATVEEYNALKHGLRARQSGMSVTLTPEVAPSNPEKDRLPIVGVSSSNGSHFPVQEVVDKERNIWRISVKSVPWQEEVLVKRLEFATMWSSVARSIMMSRILKEKQEITIPTVELIEQASKRPGAMTTFHFKRTINSEGLSGELIAIDVNDENGCWPSPEQLRDHVLSVTKS